MRRMTCLVHSFGLLVISFMTLASVISDDTADTVGRKIHLIGNGEPRLHHVENFATDAEMDLMMKTAFENMRPQNQGAETGIVHELRVGGAPEFEAVYDRMGAIFPGVGVSRDKKSETFRVRRYLPDGVAYAGGDYHPPHTDWFETTKGDPSNVLIITMIVYLTSPEKGGSTFFSHAWVNGTKGYHFAPKRGDLAVWWSCYNNGTQDLTSEHSSEPLLKGIKWNAARFFYDHTKKCSQPSAETVLVPKATEDNVPMEDSSKVMFGTTFPEGVWTTSEGTSTDRGTHGGGYGFSDEDLDMEEFEPPPPPKKKKKAKGKVDPVLEMEKELLRKQAEREMNEEHTPSEKHDDL